jgi:diguanylate cyclase (GGDEF)-like protein/PAS domain S-box-containing protein
VRRSSGVANPGECGANAKPEAQGGELDGAEAAKREAWVRAEVERRMAAAPAMMHSVNEAGLLTWVSAAWLARFGYAREEVIGRPSSDFLAPESGEGALQAPQELFGARACENARYRMVKKDGGVVDVLVSAVVQEDPSDRGKISLAVVTDITSLLQTKGLLRESEARYRSLIEDQSDLVSLASPDGELRYVNSAYASFYGKPVEAFIGRSLFDFVPDGEREAVAQHWLRVCAGPAKVEAENQVVLPTGETRWISWTNRALLDADGRIKAIHSVGRDIQQRVEAERRLQESEARYRFLFENSTDLILLIGADGRRLYASPACRKLLGYEPEETVAMRLVDAIHPDDAAHVLPILSAQPADTMLTYRMRRKDGGYVWVETTGRTVRIANGERQRLVIVRDIEARIAAEQRLKASEARYRLLADHSTDMVFHLDRRLACQYASPACQEILGFSPEDMHGGEWLAAVHPEDDASVALALEALIEGRADRLLIAHRMRRKDGRWIWVEAQLRAPKDPQTSEPTGVVGALRDVSARKTIEDDLAEATLRLQALVSQDSLTGLANRRAFDDALGREFQRARRNDFGIALIMIDVDRFKAFNDSYGHPRGDECLRLIAGAISRCVRRPSDVAARYGGEEFCVLLPGSDEAGAGAIAARIQRAVRQLRIAHNASELGVVTISAGAAACAPAGSETAPESLVRDADRALYLAKRGGRNAVVLASKAGGASSPSAAA